MHAAPPAWLRWAPFLFVFLWSTGFIGSRLGTPFAEPLTFLSWRYLALVAILGAFALATGAAWPRNAREAMHAAAAGLLVHGCYLGGVFCAIARGVPLATIALLVGIQPVITALAAGPLLGERLTRVQWLGIALGFGGVVLVVSGKWGGPAGDAIGYASGLLALAGITAGTLYQKRHCGAIPMVTGNIVQYGAAGLVTFAIALATETRVVQWTPQFLFALGWLVLVLSLGAIGLLYTMIRHGEASRVSSLFFLTPPVTAVMAYFLFGERLPPVALAGLAVSAAGVALVTRGARMEKP
ncbi:MAG: DMT family transporter [Betaproteobacteria bacterium]|nr:DMT family transporter [Betaproteobacteria bacterium]